MHDAQSAPVRRAIGLVPPRSGVVIGDGDGVEPGRDRVGDELGRGLGAVGARRVRVEVDPSLRHVAQPTQGTGSLRRAVGGTA